MLSLLISPVAKLAGGALLALSLAGGAAFLVHQHDNRVRAEVAAAEAAARLVTERADHARLVSVLEDRATAAEARAASTATIQRAISDAPASTACSQSAPMRAVVNGMRRPADRH